MTFIWDWGPVATFLLSAFSLLGLSWQMVLLAQPILLKNASVIQIREGRFGYLIEIALMACGRTVSRKSSLFASIGPESK